MSSCIMSTEKQTKLKVESSLTYHAIGQGLFSSGKLEFKKWNGEKASEEEVEFKFNYVYDCGTSSKMKKLKDRINDYKRKKISRIDMLVVSHFDKDHVSGFEQLLDKLPAKRVVLPYLEPKTRILLALKSKFSREGVTTDIILNPTKYFTDSVDEIIYIKSNSSESLNVDIIKNDDKDDAVSYYGVEIDKSTLEDESILAPDKVKVYENFSIIVKNLVKFRFYNKSVEIDRLERFFDEVEAKLPGKKLNEDLLKDKDSLKIIKNIYNREFKGGINDTSLCLSVTSIDKSEKYNDISYTCFMNKLCDDRVCDKCTQKFGYFFTGDINLSKEDTFNEYINYYTENTGSVSVFTIPHHGSIDNWNRNLIDKFNDAHWIITARGSSKHPSQTVLMDLLISSCKSTLVNDVKNKDFYNEVFYIENK